MSVPSAVKDLAPTSLLCDFETTKESRVASKFFRELGSTKESSVRRRCCPSTTSRTVSADSRSSFSRTKITGTGSPRTTVSTRYDLAPVFQTDRRWNDGLSSRCPDLCQLRKSETEYVVLPMSKRFTEISWIVDRAYGLGTDHVAPYVARAKTISRCIATRTQVPGPKLADCLCPLGFLVPNVRQSSLPCGLGSACRARCSEADCP